jgi:hypothetical protein
MSDEEKILELLETPDKTADEQLIIRRAFQAILSGEPVGQEGLVDVTGFPPDKVRGLLDALTRRGLVVLDSGDDHVVGSWGLSLVPTVHSVHMRGRQFFCWCAVDAAGIPSALEEDAAILSRCHLCGTTVNIELVAGHLQRAEPIDIHLWVATIQVGRSVAGFT